ARNCGGVMSGEHGDGRIRGPLLERFFGAQLMQVFRDVKEVFDPAGVLNPDDIVAPGPIESITQRLRILPDDREITVPHVETFFTYDDQHGFGGAVEMCNGAGFCRKTTGGTMCPSYRVTLDEEHSTRGRANALRMAITGQTGLPLRENPDWNDPGTIETLDLCLSCKACKSECPSNVDVARLKAECTGQRYREQRAPLSSRVFGNVRTLNRLGSIAPGFANWFNRVPFTRRMLNRRLGLAPQRSIPTFAPSLYRWFKKRRISRADASPPVVVLYADCFTTYNEPHVGRAAVEVLESLGYEVRLPKVGCCARSMLSLGLMNTAISTTNTTLDQLIDATSDSRVKAVVVCEPSCLSAMKDDWLQMKIAKPEAAMELASKSFLVEEFVERFWNEHPNRPRIAPRPAGPTILHGHCHQKALWGDSTSADALRRFVGDRLTVLPSGCCGMAGSFGYAAHRYDLSMKIGELSVFPPIRESPDAAIVAPGTSCRHQIKDGTGRVALHPIELIAQHLQTSSYNRRAT
ncbi:MAG: 4Fe-4S dicluster domain-containing protein, partial [Anaerolineae bacterium]|nr:4Fe-4S dicluster domain-containing protein [Phycisphaerae bacterium]